MKKVNKIKQKLRKLFANLDQNKEDVLPESAFFEILSLNAIELSARDKTMLTQKARGASVKLSNAIRYRDALTMLNIDHELAKEGRDPFAECWLYRPVGSTVMDAVQLDELDVDIRSITQLRKLTKGAMYDFEESQRPEDEQDAEGGDFVNELSQRPSQMQTNTKHSRAYTMSHLESQAQKSRQSQSTHFSTAISQAVRGESGFLPKLKKREK